MRPLQSFFEFLDGVFADVLLALFRSLARGEGDVGVGDVGVGAVGFGGDVAFGRVCACAA